MFSAERILTSEKHIYINEYIHTYIYIYIYTFAYVCVFVYLSIHIQQTCISDTYHVEAKRCRHR